MSSSILTITLGHKILPGRVTIGTYDGKRCIFTAATHGERVNNYTNSLYVRAIK
jgi:hypothetical protein